MKTRLLAVVLVLAGSGCAKVAHLDELLTLQSYSDNKDAQDRYVEKQDARFEKLLAAARTQSLSRYKNQKAVVKEFGEPVFSRPAERDGLKCRQWLYRYTVRASVSPKVYFYFDERGGLIGWEYSPSPQKGEASEESGAVVSPNEGQHL